MSLVIDDVAEVITIEAMFPLLVVLCYSLSCTVVSQVSIVAGWRCCFISDSLCPIVWSITDGGFSPTVASQPLYCYDLLSDKGTTFWSHALNRLHDGLESHDIKVQVQIPN
jgi:hypothetical protein